MKVKYEALYNWWDDLFPETQRGVKIAGTVLAIESLLFAALTLLHWKTSQDPAALLSANLSNMYVTCSQAALIAGVVLFLGILAYTGYHEAKARRANCTLPGEKGFYSTKERDEALRRAVYGSTNSESFSVGKSSDNSLDNQNSHDKPKNLQYYFQDSNLERYQDEHDVTAQNMNP